MSVPDVDLVIAVHDPARPLERAVGSALQATEASLRVTVAIHNTPAEPIVDRLGGLAADPRVRTLEVHDGIRSPAGPFNAGLDAATAAYTSVMGSDDELEPGAVDSWLGLARRTGAAAVIARLRHAGGRAVPTPPTRPGRTRALDPVADRLSYRSAPLGLISRDRFPDLRFGVGLPVGEDVGYVTRVWFSGEQLAYDRRGPSYLIHTDAAGRTTVSPRPIAEELAYIPALLADPWYQALPQPSREAIAVKLLRIHIFGALSNRDDPAQWPASEREALREVVQMIRGDARGALQVLSRRDRDVLDAIDDLPRPVESLLASARARRPITRPSALLPRRLSLALHREAPLRMAAASALQLR